MTKDVLQFPVLISAVFNRQTEEITLNWGDDQDESRKMGETLLAAVGYDKTVEDFYRGGQEPPHDLLQEKNEGGIPPADL